jgi:hypothetical protein
VRCHRAGSKRLHHPVVGELEISYETMTIDADYGLYLAIYPCERESASHTADLVPAMDDKQASGGAAIESRVTTRFAEGQQFSRHYPSCMQQKRCRPERSAYWRVGAASCQRGDSSSPIPVISVADSVTRRRPLRPGRRPRRARRRG